MNFRNIWSERMSIKCCFKQRTSCSNYTLSLYKIKQNLQLHLINTRTILVLVTLTDIRCYLYYIGGKTKCVKMNETLNQWKAL